MSNLTEKERQAIEIKKQEALRNLSPVIDHDYKCGFCDGMDVGVKILAELRKEETPSEDLESEIVAIMISNSIKS